MFRVCEVHPGGEQATQWAVKSPFAPVILPVIALLAALARWKTQGSGNLYTALHKRFYVPDPDLGWQVSPQHPIWLGLEVIAVIAAFVVGLVLAGWIIRRREARRGEPARILRGASWLVALVPLVVPLAAFASGGGPANAKDTLPASTIAGIEAGIVGTIDAPAGRYEVVENPATAITAKLSAGHETFDARFGGGIRGSWQGDPRDLTSPMGGTVSVDTASVDTGIDERSKHASTEYLHADKYPRISVAIAKIIAASQSGANTVTFRAHGTLGLLGKTHAVELTGTLTKPDAAALGRLGVTGDVLLVRADFAVVIKETALASDAGDFDGDRIPVHVSLVLRHTSG